MFKKSIALAVVMIVSAACGGAESKSGPSEGESGEPTVDITGGNSETNNTASNNSVIVSDNSANATIDGSYSSVAYYQTVEFPAGEGSTTQVLLSTDVNVCESLPDDCVSEPTGEGTVMRVVLFAGTPGATGTYVVGNFDEEQIATETRVATGALSPVSGGTEAMEIESGQFEILTHGYDEVSGTFDVQVGGESLRGSFSSEPCAKIEELAQNC